jgi:hypothetical protein
VNAIATFTIDNNVILTNDGTITNNGALTNSGRITNNGFVVNYGTITKTDNSVLFVNYGSILSNDSVILTGGDGVNAINVIATDATLSSDFILNSGKTITVNATKTFTIDDIKLTNNGFIVEQIMVLL